MKISVVVIAHNEEKYIGKCLDSLMHQSLLPDEVIVVAHNCTDKTAKIASGFNVKVDILNDNKKGQAYSRYRGIYLALGDKILCTDGDTIVSPNWVETMDKLLDEKKKIMAGTRVKYIGNLFYLILNNISYTASLVFRDKTLFIWGPSFGFTKQVKEMVLEYIDEFSRISEDFKHSSYPDDFWIAKNIKQNGKIMFSNSAPVSAFCKKNSWESIIRSLNDVKNVNTLNKYLKQKISKNKNVTSRKNLGRRISKSKTRN